MKHFVCFSEIFLFSLKELNYISRVSVKDESFSGRWGVCAAQVIGN